MEHIVTASQHLNNGNTHVMFPAVCSMSCIASCAVQGMHHLKRWVRACAPARHRHPRDHIHITQHPMATTRNPIERIRERLRAPQRPAGPCAASGAVFAAFAAPGAQRSRIKSIERRREKLGKPHNDCTKPCALFASSEPSEGSRGSQHGPSKVREFRRRTVPYLSHRNSRTHGSHNYHLCNSCASLRAALCKS